MLASPRISLSKWTDFLCCCTNFISVAASETLSHIVAQANFLWGLCRNIYPSSTPVFCCLVHHSPGDIIHYFLSSCLWLGWSNIMHQQCSENEVVSMVTCGANNGRRVVWLRFQMLPSISQHRGKETIVSAGQWILIRGSSFNSACLPFFVPSLMAVDWHES